MKPEFVALTAGTTAKVIIGMCSDEQCVMVHRVRPRRRLRELCRHSMDVELWGQTQGALTLVERPLSGAR